MDLIAKADWDMARERWYSCPALRNYVIDRAKNEVRNNRHFTIAFLFEDVRRKEFTGRDGVMFKVNNSLKPAYARLLLIDYPECKKFLEIRKSRFDEVMQ